MIVKTQDLDGAPLNWAVAKAGDLNVRLSRYGAVLVDLHAANYPEGIRTFGDDAQWEIYTPSRDWAVAGPIIQRERILVAYSDERSHWNACYTVDGNPIHRFDGATPLVAAMRTYVGFTLGGEAEIPEELTC